MEEEGPLNRVSEEEDWCYAAKKRVAEGSDGLWIRFGPKVDDSLKSQWFSFRCNPCVSCGAIVMLFGFVIFTMAMTPGPHCLTTETMLVNQSTEVLQYNTDKIVMTDTSGASPVYVIERHVVAEQECYVPLIEFKHWKKWVTVVSTWLYIGTQDAWILFLFVVLFSKYSKLKLGPDDEPPDFSYFEWFAMIFCCGVATGLFFFSVAEPIWHYEACGTGAWWSGADPSKCRGNADWANRYSHLPDNFRAQESMGLTFYHWGLHGWVAYAVLGVLLGLLHFRKGLPMTVKSCFYPLIGERIYGFWGDLLDAVSVVATTFGVCTSLGLGVMQINTGMKRLNGGKNWMGTPYFGLENKNEWLPDDVDKYKASWDGAPKAWRVSHPWTTASGEVDYLMAGNVAQVLKDNSQQIALIWIITVVSTLSVSLGLKRGIKWFSLVAWVLGMFLLWVIFAMDDTWFLCNLFVQTLGHYIQNIVQVGFYAGAFDQPTQFSGGSDGRQEYANWMNDWTIFYWGWWIAWAPFVGVFLARISKGRTIREFIVCVMVIAVGYNFAWMTVWGGAALKMEMTAAKNGINDCSAPTKNICRPVDSGMGRYSHEPEFVCSTVTRLSCHGFDSTPMIFDLIEQYGDLAPIMTVITLITIVMYFVTSSDSGSMVDDMVAANGIPDPPIAQRIFWSLTEGLAATGLMFAGRFDPSSPNSGLKALQAASIAVGLPYTFLVCFMCLALWRTLQYEFGEREWGKGFSSNVLDFGITAYRAGAGNNRGCNFALGRIDVQRLVNWVKFFCVPFLGLFPTLQKIEQKKGSPRSTWPMIVSGFVAVFLFYLGWILVLADWAEISPGGYNSYGEWNNATHWNMVDTRVSQRYGTFRYYTNKWEVGMALQEPTTVYTDHGETQAMGDRIGQPMHIAVFGWFFILVFVSVVTFARTSVRGVCKIPGNFAEDALASLFLWPSVLIQCNDALDGKGAVGKPKEESQEEPAGVMPEMVPQQVAGPESMSVNI